MHLNSHFSLEQIAEYFNVPDAQRPLARYREDLLEPEPAFTPEEACRLKEIVRLNDVGHSRFSVSRLLIDLSWASSYLEGNTYTQLDTQALIEYGERNKDKPAEDAAMILNHKRAIEHMLAHPSLTSDTILAIHGLLADDRLAPGSRHFLPPQKCAVVRSYTENGLYINGSAYIPPQAEDRPVGYIAKQFQRLIASADILREPINQAFFVMTRLPYLQAFYDANKRTSRISCNIPLVQAGLAPLSFVDFAKSRYIGGMLAFYELGDERLAKAAFLDAYIASAFRYLNFGESARFALAAARDQHVADAHRYVLDGTCAPEPIWLRSAPKRTPDFDSGSEISP